MNDDGTQQPRYPDPLFGDDGTRVRPGSDGSDGTQLSGQGWDPAAPAGPPPQPQPVDKNYRLIEPTFDELVAGEAGQRSRRFVAVPIEVAEEVERSLKECHEEEDRRKEEAQNAALALQQLLKVEESKKWYSKLSWRTALLVAAGALPIFIVGPAAAAVVLFQTGAWAAIAGTGRVNPRRPNYEKRWVEHAVNGNFEQADADRQIALKTRPKGRGWWRWLAFLSPGGWAIEKLLKRGDKKRWQEGQGPYDRARESTKAIRRQCQAKIDERIREAAKSPVLTVDPGVEKIEEARELAYRNWQARDAEIRAHESEGRTRQAVGVSTSDIPGGAGLS